VWKVKLIVRVHHKSQEGNNSLRVNDNSLYNHVTSDCASTIQRIQFICIRQIHIFLIKQYLEVCTVSHRDASSIQFILSFEFKNDYITSNYKVLTIINITVHVCVTITVKFKNPILVHPAYSEQIVHPIVSPTNTDTNTTTITTTTT